ncbi:MAG TPA: carbohydrate ABC transporter permease [Fimbriimonadaceae bacterium]|nr:carbohydrate ABC transporter permease [Fimbriimonadaceae bacterium]
MKEFAHFRHIAKAVASYAAMLLIAGFLMAPFVWMVLVALHPPKSPIPAIDELWPVKPDFGNFGRVLTNPHLPVARFFLNSVVVAGAVVVGQLAVSACAAYAFARLRFAGRGILFAAFLGSMMIGGAATQIPVYLMLRSFGWLDTYAALIVPGLSSAFSVFLLRQAFSTVPAELGEAARLDGAGEMRILAGIFVPLSRAAVATCATFTFIGVWTDFFGPLIYTNSISMRTVEVGLSIYKNAYGGTNWPLQMSAAVIVMAPLLLVFLIGQRYFVRGITLGSIK